MEDNNNEMTGDEFLDYIDSLDGDDVDTIFNDSHDIDYAIQTEDDSNNMEEKKEEVLDKLHELEKEKEEEDSRGKVEDIDYSTETNDDIENTSTNSGLSNNDNIPSESGYNNDSFKEQAQKEAETAKEIGFSGGEHKTNYNANTWNQGMSDHSTEVVSDERMKEFVTRCLKKEPGIRMGAKKITQIIRPNTKTTIEEVY